MPRSGSELIQVLMDQNPKIYGSATSPLLEYLFAMRGNYDLPEVKAQDGELMYNCFLNACRGAVEGYTNTISDKEIILDKNRGNAHFYEFWEQILEEQPKMICVVRDLRSILASFERVYRNNRHSPQGIDNPAQMENMTVAERANYWCNTQPVGLALKRTQDTFQKGLAEKIHFIKYEDLLLDPKLVMKGIYEYIGEEEFFHDFKNIEKKVVEDDIHFGIFGSHKVAKELKKFKPNDWSDVYNREIADAIVNGNRWYFDTFNY
jgi:sulfotransferase